MYFLTFLECSECRGVQIPVTVTFHISLPTFFFYLTVRYKMLGENTILSLRASFLMECRSVVFDAHLLHLVLGF